MRDNVAPGAETGARLADVSEEELLARIVPLMARADERVLLGPGDDAAVMAAPDGRFVATTDAVARGTDWRDDWSSGDDVGRKVVAQNLGDVAAMGALPAGLLVTLLADPETPLDWVLDLARGIGAAASAAACPVLGGDLGGAPDGVVMVSVTAFGDLQGRAPILRSGAREGDVVAIAGTLGRSGAGLILLQERPAGAERAAFGPVEAELVAAHRAPVAPYDAGPLAARHGAQAMIDVSDGLVRDAGRIAASSGVRLALATDLLEADVAAIAPALGRERALEAVLTGGEEHSLLATYPAGTALPAPFRAIGRVVAGEGVTVDGRARRGGGWDHFAG